MMPGASGYPNVAPSAHVRRWVVTHACEAPAPLALLADAQQEIGMRPALLTLSGWVRSAELQSPVTPLSLVHAWREVRQWRALFLTENVGAPGEVLHAHCFSAGMAGVRAGVPIVYDFAAQIGSCSNAGPWLTRSLRIAEGFVLTRASAVVVHSQAMWDAAVAQGVQQDNLFLIPDPIATASTWSHPVVPPCSRRIRASVGESAVTFYASGDSDLELVLRAFTVVAEETENARLILDCAGAAIERRAAELGIAARVHFVAAGERAEALEAADVVIAGPWADGPNLFAIAALAHGRTLLAADVAANREISADGRGCLWYASGNERDLAFRAAFLARNPDFRAALAANGRVHLQATRSPVAVARRYDEVYRHALSGQGPGRPEHFLRVPAFALCC